MRVFLGLDSLIIAIYSIQTFDTHRDWLGIGIGVILMLVALVSVFTATDVPRRSKEPSNHVPDHSHHDQMHARSVSVPVPKKGAPDPFRERAN